MHTATTSADSRQTAISPDRIDFTADKFLACGRKSRHKLSFRLISQKFDMPPSSAPLPITLIGAATVDLIGRVTQDYIPQTSNPGRVHRRPGGVVRNVGVLLAGMGVAPTVITSVGDDTAGTDTKTALTAAGIDLKLIPAGDFPTARYMALHDDNGELIAAVADMDIIENMAADKVADILAAQPNNGLLLADCGVSAKMLAQLSELKQDRLLMVETVSEPKSRRARNLIDRLDLVFTNRAEAGAMLDRIFATPDAAAGALVDAGAGSAVVSDGPRDIAFADQSGVRTLAIFAADVVDVTGAGDALVAGTMFGLSTGLTLADAVDCGRAAAAIAVESIGAAPTISQQDLQKRLNRRRRT